MKITVSSKTLKLQSTENRWSEHIIVFLKQQQQQQSTLQRLSGGSYTLHFLSDAVAWRPAAAAAPKARRSSATQAASWWAVDEVRGHCGAKWDLTLDKQARPRATVAYGCEGGEEAEEGWGWWPSCPLRLSRDPQLSQQTLTSPHTKHPPGRGGVGGAASFLFQTEGWRRGRMGEKVISSSCCCDVWGMLGSVPLPLLRPRCKPANYSHYRMKVWPK